MPRIKDENLFYRRINDFTQNQSHFSSAVRPDELDSLGLSKRTRRAIDQIFIEYHDESTASALRVWKFNRLMRHKKGEVLYRVRLYRSDSQHCSSTSLRAPTLFSPSSDIFSSTDRKALSIALFTKLSFGVLRKAFPWRKSNACRRYTRCTLQIAGHPTRVFIHTYIHSYIQKHAYTRCICIRVALAVAFVIQG